MEIFENYMVNKKAYRTGSMYQLLQILYNDYSHLRHLTKIAQNNDNIFRLNHRLG